MRYVKIRRLESASHLLLSGDRSLQEIAELTGHSDAFHLSHAFKKQYGLPPRTFRNQIRTGMF
jgi:AraC-like DNA-binding protein